MSKEENMRVVSLSGPIVDTRDWDRLDELYSPDFIDHDPAEGQPAGVEGVKWFFRGFTAAFADFALTPDLINANDEYVTLVFTLSGTHTGEFLGHAPTGKKFSIRSMEIIKFVNGRMAERWGSSDVLGLMQQLELL